MSKFYKTVSTIFLALGFLIVSFSVHATENEFSKKQKDEINSMIRDYILEHPEILPEAIQILQNRSKLTALKKNYSRLYEDGFSYVGGNKNGDVTLIEFFDYNCGYCKRSNSTIERILREDKNLRIIYKEFPILTETSVVAAKAAMASMNQGKYEAFHQAMIKHSGNLTEKNIFDIAKQIGLDEQLLAKAMTNPVYDRNIQINHQLAQTLEITGTPGFVIGETIVSGALPYEEMIKIIANARRQAAKKAASAK